MIWWIILILIGVLLLVEGGIFIMLTLGFLRRSDNDPNFRYFTAKDFDDITAEPISFPSGKTTLRGFIYRPLGPKPDKLLIFLMGIGAGHHAYMHVIRALVLHGYQVLAFDYTGAHLSDGKNIKGLPQAIKDLGAALHYISQRDDLNELPLDVLGHSWGGYVAGVAPRLSRRIRKVVSISGFNDVTTVLVSVRTYLRPFALFIDLANFIKFGGYGTADIATTIKSTKIPMLIASGARDPFVKLAANFDKFRLLGKHKPHIEFLLEETKSHNPYLTVEAETYFIKILKEKKAYDLHPDSPESQAFYQAIDYELITRNDTRFFEDVFAFLDR